MFSKSSLIFYYINRVSSSEKVDKIKRYSNFDLLSLPYPGCEFFRNFSANNYEAQNLIYEWSENFNDAHLSISDDLLSFITDIDFSDYQKWDLITLTQNYMRLILSYIKVYITFMNL